MCEWLCPQSPEEGLVSSGARVQGRGELFTLVLGTKLRSFDRGYVLLMAELPLNFLSLGKKCFLTFFFFFYRNIIIK